MGISGNSLGETATTDVLVIGAGPTGLAAAEASLRRGASTVVIVEKSSAVGGLARSATIGGLTVDPGGHRLIAGTPRQRHVWQDLAARIGPLDLHRVDRKSGILRSGCVLSYPFDWQQFRHAAPWSMRARTAASLLHRKVNPVRPEDTLSDWVTNRYGTYLTGLLMDPHARKVFGIDPGQIPATWAAQRIDEPAPGEIVRAAVPARWWRSPGEKGKVTSRDAFLYPDGGVGVIWPRLVASMGTALTLLTGTQVVRLTACGDGCVKADLAGGATRGSIRTRRVISTSVAEDLAASLGMQSLGRRLQRQSVRRDLIIALVQLHLMPKSWNGFQWIYTHDPGVRAHRFQNYSEWQGLNAPAGLLGLEYSVSSGQAADPAAWAASDLSILAAGKYSFLGLDRLQNSYSNFDGSRGLLAQLDDELRAFGPGVVSTGRQGAGVYINLDQALALGARVAEMPESISGVVGRDGYSDYQETLRST